MQSIQPARLAVSLAAGALLAGVASAQIRSDEVPAAISAGLDPKMVPVTFVEPPDVDRLKAEDAANNYRPLRYGALMPMDVGIDDPESGGVWDVLEDGSKVWRFKIYSPDAFTIGLEFDDFLLPAGSYCTMYDEDLRTFYGAYGSVNNQPNEEILLEPFPGDMVVFEYVQPAGVHGEPKLNLGTVIYDYRDVDNIDLTQFPTSGGAPSPGGCDFIDVNCPEGDNWELQKRATMRTLSNGSLCSGALINNTSNDGTQYVLTADHCGQGSNTSFRFNYQRSGCGTGSAPTGQNISGATLLATSSTWDLRLMQINTAIPTNWDPYFAGWSRSTSNPSFAFTMGHPNGNSKKITIDGNGADKSSIGVPNSAWFVDWTDGYIDGGSSGGPLFDQNGRVRGAACCVNDFDCVGQVAWFGRFDRFYNGSNLGQWLDPASTNPTNLDGFDPNAPVGSSLDITGISPGFIEAVRVDAPSLVTLTGTGFTNTTKVEVDGVELFGLAYTIVNDTTLQVSVGHLSALGANTIEVFDATGSDVVNVFVLPNTSLTLDMESSDPSFLIQGLGVRAYVGAPLDHYVWLTFSDLDVGSTLPGLVDLDLGNNFFNVFVLWEGSVNPAKGYRYFDSGPLSGFPIGYKVYMQAASFSQLAPTFPLFTSNLESGTILF